MSRVQSNFSHLAKLELELARLGAAAERYFADDPNTCLLKQRQFAELMAQQVAARVGIYDAQEDNQATLLARLKREDWLPRETSDLFHWLRKAGNQANHQLNGDHRTALGVQAQYNAARVRIDRLTPAILTKAFRGELVPQDPNDEPANVLLERIRAERAASPKSLRGPRRSKTGTKAG